MASVCSPRRQLAPTVRPAAALAGVSIRTGSLLPSGERVVCGLVHRIGSFDFVTDNAGDFGGRAFPAGGSVIGFGSHLVYVAIEIIRGYPEKVLVAADPPAVCAARDQRVDRVADSVEVMVISPAVDVGKGAAGDADAGAEQPRAARKPLERNENQPGYVDPSTSTPRPAPFQNVIEELTVPVAAGADPALVQVQLEERRQAMLRDAVEMSKAREEFDRDLREYNLAHGFTPVGNNPSHLDAVRNRGRELNAELAKDANARTSRTVSVVSAGRPKYSSHGKNLRAAEAAAAELPNLTGEARARQQDRVNDLVRTAARQNEAF